MKLGIQKIKEITQGAASVCETEEGICFSRFNAEENELYSNNPRLSRTRASAGIRMEFDTDAKALSMKVITEQSSGRTFYSFDVFSDNKIIGHIKNFKDEDMSSNYYITECPLGENSGEFRLEEGKKRIKIVFPWSVVPVLEEMVLEGATFVAPVKKDKKLLAYGDSITQGYDSRYPSNSYISKLADALNAECFNKAVGGELYYPQLAAIKNDFIPDYITVAYGTNDWSRGEKNTFENNCREFWEALNKTYPGVKKFAITPIWRDDLNNKDIGFEVFSDVEAFIRKTVEKYDDVICLSGFNLVPKEIEYFADLRLHPTDEGFEHYFKNLYREISKHI